MRPYHAVTGETSGSAIWGAVDYGIGLRNYQRPHYGDHMVAAIGPVLETYYRRRTDGYHLASLRPIDHLRYASRYTSAAIRRIHIRSWKISSSVARSPSHGVFHLRQPRVTPTWRLPRSAPDGDGGSRGGPYQAEMPASLRSPPLSNHDTLAALPAPLERLIAASLPVVSKGLLEWLNAWHRSRCSKPIAWSHLYGTIRPNGASKVALRIIMQSLTGETVILATLAYSIGRAVEGELKAPPKEPWSDSIQFRVGMAIIETVVNATGWFVVGFGSPDHRQAWRSSRLRRSLRHFGSPLVLMMQPTVTDWFGSEVAATLCGEAPAANTPDLMPASEAIARRHIAGRAFYRLHASPAPMHSA